MEDNDGITDDTKPAIFDVGSDWLEEVSRGGRHNSLCCFSLLVFLVSVPNDLDMMVSLKM